MKQFITFEGIDGSGKSTISKMLFDKLKSEKYNVELTYEPTSTEIGGFVQKCIETNSDPFITAFTFILDRIQHCKQIKNWLDDDKIVLCDRYVDSTYAYQGAQLENKIKNPIKWLKALSKNIIIIPDRTYLFIIPPKKSLARIQKRDDLIPFEQISFLDKVHNNYLIISKDKRFLKLDATKKIDELVNLCYKDIIS
jgi:dTMP kinase